MRQARTLRLTDTFSVGDGGILPARTLKTAHTSFLREPGRSIYPEN